MPRIAYKMDEGRASEIRRVSKDYDLLEGEYDTQGSELPTPEELNSLEVLREDRIVEVKTEAGKRIVALAGPGWKQRNLLARTAELIEEKADGGTLSSSEASELNSMKAIWARVKAMRTASNNIEVEINNLSTREEILDYDIKTNGLWPN